MTKSVHCPQGPVARCNPQGRLIQNDLHKFCRLPRCSVEGPRISFLPKIPPNKEEKRIKTPMDGLGQLFPDIGPLFHDVELLNVHQILQTEGSEA
jgi:hypothetical protein